MVFCEKVLIEVIIVMIYEPIQRSWDDDYNEHLLREVQLKSFYQITHEYI